MNLKNALLIALSYFNLSAVLAQPCNLLPVATYSPTPVCFTRPLYLFGSATGTGVSYSWTGSHGFSSTLQNPVIPSAMLSGYAKPDTYIVTVSKPGCTSENDTVTPMVYGKGPKPNASVFKKACIGDTLVLLETFAIAMIYNSYWWGPNGRQGYASLFGCYFYVPNATLADTGIYYVTTFEFAGPRCYSDTSFVHVTAADILTTPPPLTAPTITVIPGSTISKGAFLKFNAHVSNAGSYPKFQWYRNGVAIPGANDSFYFAQGGVDVMNNDSISVRTIRYPSCIDTAYSNYTKITVTTLGISSVIPERQAVIYPNPNNGTFTIISRYAQQEQISATITNALGQIVSNKQLTAEKQNELTINSTTLTPGIYYLSLRTDTSNEQLKFVVE
jgi:hypothetical protein